MDPPLDLHRNKSLFRIILRILLNLPSSPLLRPSLVLPAMEDSNSSRGFERKLDTSPFLCGLIMEKFCRLPEKR
jgi:hypothetical protein